jgi:hypothetical protein
MIKTNTQSRNVRFSATTAVTRVKKGGYKYNLGRQKWVSKATGRNSNEKKKVNVSGTPQGANPHCIAERHIHNPTYRK